MLTLTDIEGNLMPIREAARVLSVHANTLRRWADQGIISSYRIGARGDRRFLREEVFSLRQQIRDRKGSPCGRRTDL